MTEVLRLAVVGAGSKAIEYAGGWSRMPNVEFVACADVDARARAQLAEICQAAGGTAPAAFEDYRTMLAQCRDGIDAVYVSTPHALHAEQALAITEHGLDLLLEKPMVTTTAEAEALIEARNRKGNQIVIAYQGALSPLILDTQRRATGGEFGPLLSVSATIWENWAGRYDGHWKQDPALSGGGFMFDTGAHMMNTVCLLVDAAFESVSAYVNTHVKTVDIVTAVSGRLENGVLVTFHAVGDGPVGCASHITLFYTEAIVRIDAWGAWREITLGERPLAREESEIIDNPLMAFRRIRTGEQENPSTVENGLRVAQLWDAIKASAARDGAPLKISDLSRAA